jgi:hypothetical protein
MPTKRISHRFVDPHPWMTGDALERANSVIAALRAGHAMASNP